MTELVSFLFLLLLRVYISLLYSVLQINENIQFSSFSLICDMVSEQLYCNSHSISSFLDISQSLF